MGRLAMSRVAGGFGALLLCVGLAACDEKPKVATRTVTVEKPCDCTRQTAIEDDYHPEPRAHHYRVKKHKAHKKHHAKKRRHHYAARAHRDDFYKGGYHGEAAEIQGRSYSHSGSSYREEHRYYKQEEQRPMHRDRRYRDSYERSDEASGRWVDGYGRVHYASRSRYPVAPMVINSRQGRSTWHGYGVYCREPSHNHGAHDNYGYGHHHDHSKTGHNFD